MRFLLKIFHEVSSNRFLNNIPIELQLDVVLLFLKWAVSDAEGL